MIVSLCVLGLLGFNFGDTSDYELFALALLFCLPQVVAYILFGLWGDLVVAFLFLVVYMFDLLPILLVCDCWYML